MFTYFKKKHPTFKWISYTAMVALAVASTGCLRHLLLIGLLVGGPPSVEPDFDAATGLSMTARNVSVAVVCYAPSEIKYQFHDIDHKIAKAVSYKLSSKMINVKNPDIVDDWLDRNDDWDKPEEIGAALNVSYVVFIDLNKFSLYEGNSHNLYRGRAEALVSVVEMDENGDGEQIYNKDIISQYPLAVPRSTSEVSLSTFRAQYMTRLAEEIGRLFYEYYNGDDVLDAT